LCDGACTPIGVSLKSNTSLSASKTNKKVNNVLTPGGYYVLWQESGRSSVQSRGRVHYQRRPGGIFHFYYYFTGRWCVICFFVCLFFVKLEDFL